MSLKHRANTPELLDADNIPYEDMCSNLAELNTINTLLGGHAITIKGCKHFLDKYKDWNRPLIIAEIGCGGGDNLSAIRKLLQRRYISYRLVGVDIKPECLMYAARKAPDLHTTWVCSDYRHTQWPSNTKPDIIFSSLFCHHFTDEQLHELLKWLQENSTLGFFINDLHRHPVAYYSIKILTALFSASRYVKNDGPLSVKRAFIKPEWKTLLRHAGISTYHLTHEWAFRYLICVNHDR
jgi:SAM-dependent methyltransferase